MGSANRIHRAEFSIQLREKAAQVVLLQKHRTGIATSILAHRLERSSVECLTQDLSRIKRGDLEGIGWECLFSLIEAMDLEIVDFVMRPKSTVADHLKSRGWQSVHPFAGGKVMVIPYLERLGIPHATAERMVYGDLKDVAHPLLPGDGKCRTLMEKLGAFMPRELGPEWTIGVELKLARIPEKSITYRVGLASFSPTRSSPMRYGFTTLAYFGSLLISSLSS